MLDLMIIRKWIWQVKKPSSGLFTSMSTAFGPNCALICQRNQKLRHLKLW